MYFFHYLAGGFVVFCFLFCLFFLNGKDSISNKIKVKILERNTTQYTIQSNDTVFHISKGQVVFGVIKKSWRNILDHNWSYRNRVNLKTLKKNSSSWSTFERNILEYNSKQYQKCSDVKPLICPLLVHSINVLLLIIPVCNVHIKMIYFYLICI